MPLYEYECAACHRRTEKIQKFSDPELTVCPYCGGPLARTLTAPAVHFAGGGWYKDLYSSARPASSGESKSSDAAGSGGEKPASGASSETSAPKAAESAPTATAPSSASAAKPE